MTREYVQRLQDDQTGRDWKNLWRVWDYGDALPEKFNDRQFETSESIRRAKKDEGYPEPVYRS